MENTVTTVWINKMQFQSDNPLGQTLTMDTSEVNGGEANGLAPKALMLSSLAGCTGLDVVSILTKMRAKFEDFKIKVTGELTEEHPKYYHKVQVSYIFTGSDLPKDKIEKAVALSKDQYCGVMEMFRKFAEVSTEIVYLEA